MNDIKDVLKEEYKDKNKKDKKKDKININETNNKLINEDSTLMSFGISDNYNKKD